MADSPFRGVIPPVVIPLTADRHLDLEALERNDRGLFTGGQPTLMDTPKVLNGYVERSNTDLIKQMTEMITYQRALQSAAQVSKMYDQLMTKATTDIGRL